MAAFAVLLALHASRPAFASPGRIDPGREKIFYLILMSGVNISELAEAQPENISRLMVEGSSAMLSSRAQSRYNLGSAYFSINTSNYAKCKRGCNLGFNELEVLPGNIPALFRFATSTGIMPEPFSVLNLFRSVKPIRRNVNYIYPGQPGVLGNAMRQAGVNVYVYGNSDIIGAKGYNYRREVSIVGMDTSGITRFGDVSEDIILNRNDFPLGLSLDEREVGRRLDAVKGPALVIIELSDFQRLNSIMSSAELSSQFTVKGPDWAKAYFLTTAARSDGLVGAVMKRARERGGRVMLSLVRGRPAMRNDGYVSIFGDGVPTGWLTSQTTHRRGFVSIIDIAPTIISYFDADIPDKVYGKEIVPYARPASVTIQTLAVKAKALEVMDFKVRPMFIRFYCVAIILLLIALLVHGSSAGDKPLILTRAALYFLALQPLTSCASSFFPYEGFLAVFALAAVSALIVSFLLAFLLRSWQSPVVLAAFAFSVFMISDFFFGSRMPLNTIFGYSTHYAGRFYGVGNIQMAQLIGAVSVVIASITANKRLPVWGKSAIAATGGICCCVMMAVSTNFGGIISALVTFSLMAIYFYVRKLSGRTLATLFALGVAFIVMIILASRLIPAVSQTHFGVFFGKLSEGEFSYVFMILKGKAKLLLTSFFGIYWDLLLAAMLFVMGFVFARRREEASALFAERPELFSVGKALFYGGIAGFIFNDSGVSVTVNMWLYWIFVFFMIMAQRGNRPGGAETLEEAAA